MPAPSADPKPASRAVSPVGRRLGIGLFALIVGGITFTLSAQIISHAFNDTGAASSAESRSDRSACSVAVTPLWDALQRARRSAAEALSEQAALTLFREQLQPEWERLPAARSACGPDAKDAEGLAELVLLRFEEEHSVRFEARGLAAARGRVQRWVEGQGVVRPPEGGR